MSTIKASELFIFGFNGLSLPHNIARFIGHNNTGGLILFKRNIESLEQVIALNAQIMTSNALNPPLISVDQEGGRVARLRGITSDIPPMALCGRAFKSDPDLCYRLGAMIGRELVALGFHLNFAPVCDVAIDQEVEDIIGDRAFSDDALEVARLSALFIKGMQGAGLGASAKHFPGHGATRLDSHLVLPHVDTDEKLMRDRELLPFKAAIDAGVATIMTAHIIASAFDTMPATMSERILKTLLREEMGFRHVTISDDLDMKAVADNYDLKEILEKSLMASVDMFIVGNNVDKTFEAINILQQLIDTNEHLEKAAHQALLRIKHLRARFLGAPAIPTSAYAKAVVKSTPHLELAEACR